MSDRCGIATNQISTEGLEAFRQVFGEGTEECVALRGRFFASYRAMSDEEVIGDTKTYLERVVALCPDLLCNVVVARDTIGGFLAYSIQDGVVTCVGAMTERERMWANGEKLEPESE